MRRSVLFSCAFVAACASGGSNSSTPQRSPIAIYESPETGTLFANRPPSSAIPIASPQPTVWIAVKKAYADLDIPLTVDNQAGHQLGNDNIVKSREMSGKPMSNWVDCGTSITGDKSMEYRIYASLITEVTSDGKGGTNVRTTFAPLARDMASGTADRIVCASTGRLEQAIIADVESTLGKS